MSKIKMLESTPGAINDGLTVVNFRKGLVYPNKEVEDLEGLDKIFLEIGVAEVYATPDEVERHENGMSGAPVNKRALVPENKDSDGENKKVLFTAEELEGATAGEIRNLAKENSVDLSDFAFNVSAKTLISMYLERQDN